MEAAPRLDNLASQSLLTQKATKGLVNEVTSVYAPGRVYD